jgi:hypothetical protein
MNRLQSIGFYQAIIEDRENWQLVSRITEAKPGDIIVWRDREIKPNRNTGHIVVVLESPKYIDENVVSVRVMDASSSIHDDDTRPTGGHGVGQGTMRFRVNERNEPTGTYWSSRQSEPKQKAIAIGRLQRP